MLTADTTLFSPVTIAGLQLQNRVVMPPMATAMEYGGPQMTAWYDARARGGVGLIIVEAFSVKRLADPDKCALLAPLVEVCHTQGVPVVQQMFFAGQTADGEAIAPSQQPGGARAATEDELAAIPELFAQAATNLKAIGMDGVEPHGAHGFFLSQMFSPIANRRTDRYGGSVEARMTLGLEIVAAVRGAVGAGYPIFYRHTAEGEGFTIADSIEFLRKLVVAGVDVPDVSPSWRGKVHCEIAAPIREARGVPVLAVGEMQNVALAEESLQAGRCDLCAVGRQLIADADWPLKASQGREDEIIACTQCDLECYGNLARGVPIGCAENPASGMEYLQA